MKSFKRGDLKVVDFILNDTFKTAVSRKGWIVEGVVKCDYELSLERIKLNGGEDVKEMMVEVWENKLWEDFKIENKDGWIFFDINACVLGFC